MAASVHAHDSLYRLIIGQLRLDGHEAIATSLSKAVLANSTNQSAPPSDRLRSLVELGRLTESKGNPTTHLEEDVIVDPTPPQSCLNFEASVESEEVRDAPTHAVVYASLHKAACRTVALSGDGNFFATGCIDGSVRIFNTVRAASSRDDSGTDSRPVLRQLADHTAPVNDISFHPHSALLASASKDCTIRLVDFTASGGAAHAINDSASVRALSFHPSGDYLLAATDHNVVRLYDTQTAQCFAAASPYDHHMAPVTCVRYAHNATMYASGCKGGLIKLWDGVSSRCTMTLEAAHRGAPISSVAWSRSSLYLLSCGRDSIVRLWDIRTGRALLSYEGAVHKAVRAPAVFSHDEAFVYAAHELSNSIAVFDAVNTARVRTISGHGGSLRCFSHSPVTPLLVSCCDDRRTRLWAPA